MKLPSILALILICTVAASAQQHEAQTPRAEDIVEKMIAHDRVRDWISGGYTGSREYVLNNHLLNKRAEMVVSVQCDRNGVKHFDVASEDGWKSANKRVLRQMLATEADSSQPDVRPKTRITADNYTFRLIGTKPLEGRPTYVIQASPKRQDKTLFRGDIWVDAEDYALARVEGEPAKNPSIWTRKVAFVQQYKKEGSFWFPLETTSTTDARVFGKTEVRIRYFDYKPMSVKPSRPSDSSDPSTSEAEYAKR